MKTISFVVPAYNEEAILEGCLLAIKKEMERTPCEAEVVVVNNASTDRTKDIAIGCGVKVVDEPRKGLVFARKAGFHATDGRLVANIDADTILPTGWLTKVLHEFDTQENLVILSGPFIYYDLSVVSRMWVKLFYFFGYIIQHLLHMGVMVQGGNFIVKRSSLELIGGFNTDIVFYGEDLDLGRRLREVGKVVWTFKLPVYSSGRRIKSEGIFGANIRYAINYCWIFLFGIPFSIRYKDFRVRNEKLFKFLGK